MNTPIENRYSPTAENVEWMFNMMMLESSIPHL